MYYPKLNYTGWLLGVLCLEPIKVIEQPFGLHTKKLVISNINNLHSMTDVAKFEKGTEICNVQNSLFFFIYFNFSWIFSWISWISWIFLISWNGQIFFLISWNCPISFWIFCTFYQTLYIICPLPKDKAKQLKVCLM